MALALIPTPPVDDAEPADHNVVQEDELLSMDGNGHWHVTVYAEASCLKLRGSEEPLCAIQYCNTERV
jgi:hypothetical protein